MVCLSNWFAAVTVATFALAGISSAHPGAHEASKTETQFAARKLFVDESKRLLQNCVNSENGRKLQEKAVARRLAKIETIQAQRRRLTLTTALATDHKSNLTGLNATTNPSELFGSTAACVLEPEVTEGPYYAKGELIRSDIRETQPGIDLHMDLQFIDVNTCTPVDQLYVDFWHANLTGVYSGVIASGNGNSNDATNINATFLRGLSPTDANGFVSFTTKFPGHYTGRTTHVHIMSHHNGTLLANNTYSGGSVSHVGQLFFDQSLITEVQATSAYAVNTNAVTANADDNIAAQAAADGFDPFVKYVLLGNTVEAGLLGWISVGVNMTQAYSVSAAVTMTATGGVASTSTTSGGGPNGGTPPSGGNVPGTPSSSATPSASNGSTAGSAGTTVSADTGNAGETLRSSLLHVGGLLLSMAYLLL
ncbi:hypothetical protein BBJ28_00015567 [Nothophytophthora sp. Chile5]|nr:hypothetical protein BBJ28_00015567 [Nothophytophthora sp. Chile5]